MIHRQRVPAPGAFHPQAVKICSTSPAGMVTCCTAGLPQILEVDNMSGCRSLGCGKQTRRLSSQKRNTHFHDLCDPVAVPSLRPPQGTPSQKTSCRILNRNGRPRPVQFPPQQPKRARESQPHLPQLHRGPPACGGTWPLLGGRSYARRRPQDETCMTCLRHDAPASHAFKQAAFRMKTSPRIHTGWSPADRPVKQRSWLRIRPFCLFGLRALQ